MKKILFLFLATLCLSTQVYADKVTASTILPENGKPEHVYTMVSGNGSPAKVGGMNLKYYLRIVKNTIICRTKRY